MVDGVAGRRVGSYVQEKPAQAKKTNEKVLNRLSFRIFTNPIHQNQLGTETEEKKKKKEVEKEEEMEDKQEEEEHFVVQHREKNMEGKEVGRVEKNKWKNRTWKKTD